jgi:DNA-binding NarL/FixJ family response regulator
VRIVIAEDSALFREGLIRLLTDRGMDIVGTAVTYDEFLEVVRRHRPDVAVTDIRLPPGFSDEGIRAAEAIRGDVELATGVLVLSQYLDVTFATRLLAAGSHGVGYLLKETVVGSAALADAVVRVAQGESVIDRQLVQELVRQPSALDPLRELTEREREVLELMAEGRSNAGIAERLVVTDKTVEFHISSIFSKLGLAPAAGDHRRVLAVLSYLDGTPRPRPPSRRVAGVRD